VKGKSRILDQFCNDTGYERKYATKLLRRGRPETRGKRGPKERYSKDVAEALRLIWLDSDQACARKIKAILPGWLPRFEEKYGGIRRDMRNRLLAISPATIDRILEPVRSSYHRKGIYGTHAGSPLRKLIPVRRDIWKARLPGLVTATAIPHSRKSTETEGYVWSLVIRDVSSGWTTARAVWSRGPRSLTIQVRGIEAELPFPLRGFHCDNSAEFLDPLLLSYLTERETPIRFTRRGVGEDISPFLASPNPTDPNRLFGNVELDERRFAAPLNNLYANEWSTHNNFFSYTAKLLHLRPIPGGFKEEYDTPRTPYERLVATRSLHTNAQRRLKRARAGLSAERLKSAIDRKADAILGCRRWGVHSGLETG